MIKFKVQVADGSENVKARKFENVKWTDRATSLDFDEAKKEVDEALSFIESVHMNDESDEPTKTITALRYDLSILTPTKFFEDKRRGVFACEHFSIRIIEEVA